MSKALTAFSRASFFSVPPITTIEFLMNLNFINLSFFIVLLCYIPAALK